MQMALIIGERSASLCAGMLRGMIKDRVVIDCAGRSIGLALKENKYQVLIPKNTIIPTQKKDTFVTTAENQEYIKLSVYEGENKKADLNRRVHGLRNRFLLIWQRLAN